MISSTAVLWMALLSAEPHGHSGDPHRKHGNPADLDAYISKMEAPDREGWQKPDEVIRALNIKPGQVICDIGAGPGYFALRLGRAVGEGGAVLAVDVESKILEVLRDRIAQSGLRNVTPVLSLPDDPLLPRGACDLVLIVDTFHHFPDQSAYLRRLAGALRAGGRLANIDFHKKELPVGPPVEHKVSREEFLSKATAAGLRVTAEPTFLPYQYFLILEPTRSPKGAKPSSVGTPSKGRR